MAEERFWSNLALLVKMHTVYGTDPNPTPAADAIQANEVRYKPVVSNKARRNLIKGTMGHQGVILTGVHSTISFRVELAGSGTAGTAPAWGPLVRACGMAEVITAATDVQYNPISKLHEACAIYFIMDGRKHVMLGCRGTFTLNLTPNDIPSFEFTFTGLIGTVADVPVVPGDYSKFIDPLPVSPENTTFSLGGYAGGTEGITFNIGNQIQPDIIINSKAIRQVNREMTGTAIMRSTDLATMNWIARMRGHQLNAMIGQHGTVAGNIIKVSAPKVQVEDLDYTQTNNLNNESLQLIYQPDQGNDEFKLIAA